MILVSACLAGINCKYNGSNNYNQEIFKLVKAGKAIPVCPEQLGGLQTPRAPAEIKIINGKKHVINNKKEDVTYNFQKGAQEVLQLAKRMKIKKVILKSRSPSCGIGKIYSGDFNNALVDGNGILVDLLLENGIEVLSVDNM